MRKSEFVDLMQHRSSLLKKLSNLEWKHCWNNEIDGIEIDSGIVVADWLIGLVISRWGGFTLRHLWIAANVDVQYRSPGCLLCSVEQLDVGALPDSKIWSLYIGLMVCIWFVPWLYHNTFSPISSFVLTSFINMNSSFHFHFFLFTQMLKKGHNRLRDRWYYSVSRA